MITEFHFWPHTQEMEAGYQRDICTPMFIAALFTVVKIWKHFSAH